MPFNDTEVTNIKRRMKSFMEKRRPPIFVRDEVDLEYRIWSDDVVIYKVNYINKKKYESPIAKIALNSLHTRWVLYKMEQPNQWVAATKEPIPSFLYAIKIVENDEIGCFFG